MNLEESLELIAKQQWNVGDGGNVYSAVQYPEATAQRIADALTDLGAKGVALKDYNHNGKFTIEAHREQFEAVAPGVQLTDFRARMAARQSREPAGAGRGRQ